MISPYVCYDYPKSTLVPISSRLNGFSRLIQNHSFTEDCGHGIEQKFVFTVAWNRRKKEDKAYRYFITYFFARMQEILVNVSVNQPEFDMKTALLYQKFICQQDSSKLRKCFIIIPESVSRALTFEFPDVETSTTVTHKLVGTTGNY